MKLIDIINEHIRDTETVWMWISPDNQIHQVPKLQHRGFIVRRYNNFTFDDDAFDAAFKDGWVRGIYEYNSHYFKGELSLNGYNKSRVINVLKTVFSDLIRYGNMSIYLDYENPEGHDSFSTFSTESKQNLTNFLNSEQFTT